MTRGKEHLGGGTGEQGLLLKELELTRAWGPMGLVGQLSLLPVMFGAPHPALFHPPGG